MKIIGIVAEYNPFHNGHKYQIMQAKSLSGADCVVAVMSGSFVQRGEPAICDKWARAKMALLCGVDLVIELPVVYSAQSAEYFAAGAVKLLNAIGADYISFGAEDDNTEKLMRAARLFCDEPEEFKEILGNALESGISFPAARQKASRLFGADDIIKSPNNILAVEYLKAMLKTSSKMLAVPVKRTGSQHDKEGSASYIRGISLEEAEKYMPPHAHAVLAEETLNGKAPVTVKSIEGAVMSRLRLITASELAKISGVSEGLENRIKQAAVKSANLEELVDCVKSKRYTHSRVRRIMINALLGVRNTDISRPPRYIRVLGANEKGRAVLRRIKDVTALPVIIKAADAKHSRQLMLDFAASDIYSLMYPDTQKRIGGLDKKTSPIIINA